MMTEKAKERLLRAAEAGLVVAIVALLLATLLPAIVGASRDDAPGPQPATAPSAAADAASQTFAAHASSIALSNSSNRIGLVSQRTNPAARKSSAETTS